MAVSKYVSSGDKYVYIETDGAGASSGSASAQFNKAVQSIASDMARTINSLNDDSKPDSMVVKFGLKYSEGGEYVITQTQEVQNFSVELTFKASSKDLIPGF